jgi:hypothetical protein
LLLGACSDSKSATGESEDGLTESSDGSGSAGSGGFKLDVNPATTSTDSDSGSAESPNEACKKVDVILAVDNSSSMAEEIAALRGPVFDSLPQQLLEVGNGIDDFQLAVIDACPKAANYHDTGNGGACNFSTERNYMSSNSPALADEFACVTDLSAAGYMGIPDMCEDLGENDDDDEQPALTAATSVQAEYVAGANIGFLRPDALLFVVAITDEDETFINVDGPSIFNDLVEAKSGNPEHVVFLGIGGGSACTGVYGTALEATNLMSVVDQFASYDRGIFADLCVGDLEAAFLEGITALDTACDEFEPEG